MTKRDHEKIISVAEMRAADRYTIEKGTPSKELMRRAARGIFDAGDARGIWSGKKTLIVCGSGNNGGDGYALAEIMEAQNLNVTLMRVSEKFSEDGAYYYDRCKACGVKEIGWPRAGGESSSGGADGCGENAEDVFSGFDVIVDCILGTGFSGTPREDVAAVINAINKAGAAGVSESAGTTGAACAYIVSADINSGMNGDTGEAEIAVKSNLTVSIGYYKHGLFLGRAEELIGELVNVDIGIELV